MLKSLKENQIYVVICDYFWFYGCFGYVNSKSDSDY